jgi:hypothetical protein
MSGWRWYSWWAFWFLVEVALMIWYAAGGSKNLIPVANVALVVSMAAHMKRAPWLARACYAALWVFALWWLWGAFH